MKVFAALAMVAALAGGAMAAPAVPAPTPRPVQATQGCLDHAHLLSHAAYTPDTSMPSRGCGHLLSTDTVVHGDRWNRT